MTTAEPGGTNRDGGAARLRTAEHFLALLGRSDVEPVLDLLSPSATYHVSGTHALSGTFSTPEDILSHLRDLATRTKGTMEATKWDDWLIGDYHVACIGRLHMQANGQIYKGRHVFFFAFDSNDQIDAITVFYEDPAAAMRFFYKM
jgi:ketosteroid isomerase-like protein